ncbi:MAG: beta-ketoacyl-[acyl-carrier-protein] synthase family protein [Pirellulaceae bacterium]
MASRRVVITGMGLVSPLGVSPADLWDGLTSSRSGIARFQSLPAEALPTPFGGEAREFTGDIQQFGPLEKTLQRNIKKGLKLMCREIEMGVAAAQLALTDAGLTLGKYDPERTGVLYGSDYIMTTPDEFIAGIRRCIDAEGQFHFERWGSEGLNQVTPLWLLKYLPNMPASHIAIYNDLRGPSNSITLREASSNLAVGEAAATIARGAADIIVAGATGTRVHAVRTVHVMLQEQVADGALEPERACRPFDRDRTGMVLGEGAGALVLEDLETAQARGATILGEIAGAGSSAVRESDGIADYEESIFNAVNAALAGGKLKASEVGHVCAHGIATQKCDAEEARAVKRVFDGRPIPVTAPKSNFGNLGAGGGMVELIASIKALVAGRLYPTLNYETPDPNCDIHVARGDEEAGDSFVNVNITPQGQASAVAVRKWGS